MRSGSRILSELQVTLITQISQIKKERGFTRLEINEMASAILIPVLSTRIYSGGTRIPAVLPPGRKRPGYEGNKPSEEGSDSKPLKTLNTLKALITAA